MESVSASSCSSKGSASETKVNNPRKIHSHSRESKHQLKSVFRNDDSLRITRGRRPSQALDERRDDYFAVSKPMWHQLPVPPPGCPQYYPHRVYYMPTSVAPASKWYQGSNPRKWHSQGIHHPSNRPAHVSTQVSWNTHGKRTEYARHQLASVPTRSSCARSHEARNDILIQPAPGSSKQYTTNNTQHISRVVFPQNIKVSFAKRELIRVTTRICPLRTRSCLVTL